MSQSNVVTVDVRDDIRTGKEPFARIMAAVDALADGQRLELINVFEPIPLYAVMASRGFDHETAHMPDGDWQIVFYRALVRGG